MVVKGPQCPSASSYFCSRRYVGGWGTCSGLDFRVIETLGWCEQRRDSLGGCASAEQSWQPRALVDQHHFWGGIE